MADPGDARAGVRAFRVPARPLNCVLLLSILSCPVHADRADDLTAGEAYYMSGNFAESARRLEAAAGSGTPAQARRALYLLGRISLLKGDFRLAKEYFERSADSGGSGSAASWMALAGIGDTLYASGRPEEAIRRYRAALRDAPRGGQTAVIDLRIALCEYSLSRDAAALSGLRNALKRIPVLSGWVGREEEFYHTMVMSGIEPTQAAVSRIYVRAGPVKGDFKVDEFVEPGIAVREIRDGEGSYLEFGPLADPVEAMILSEKLQGRFSVQVEIVTR